MAAALLMILQLQRSIEGHAGLQRVSEAPHPSISPAFGLSFSSTLMDVPSMSAEIKEGLTTCCDGTAKGLRIFPA